MRPKNRSNFAFLLSKNYFKKNLLQSFILGMLAMAANNRCDPPSIQQPDGQTLLQHQKSSVRNDTPIKSAPESKTDDDRSEDTAKMEDDNTLLGDTEEATLPIQEEEIPTQPKFIHPKLNGETWWLEQDLTCTICFDEIKGKESIYTLSCSCKAAYHKSCIIRLLNFKDKDNDKDNEYVKRCSTCRRDYTDVIDISAQKCIQTEIFIRDNLKEKDPATTDPNSGNYQPTAATDAEREGDTFLGPGQIRCHTCNYCITPCIVYDKMQNYYRPSCPKCTVFQNLLLCSYCDLVLAPNKTYDAQLQCYIASCSHCKGLVTVPELKPAPEPACVFCQNTTLATKYDEGRQRNVSICTTCGGMQ